MNGSHYLRPLNGPENSSVFHNHIDAASRTLLREIVGKINNVSLIFQTKIYPVSHLHLGPQTTSTEFSSVYECLPNFHTIEGAPDEAFATGKMGEVGFDYDQINATLAVVAEYPGQRVMTELEEDIYHREFDELGQDSITLNNGNTPYEIDWSKLPGLKEKQIANVPRFELHHGFDFDKQEGETVPPIQPSMLSEKTTEAGFQTGGWFIFGKEKSWSYRSNEFTNADYDPSLKNLNEQALKLRKIVTELLPNRNFTSSCSMEKVHAIWRIA